MTDAETIRELEKEVAKLKHEKRASFYYTFPKQEALSAEYGLKFERVDDGCRLSIHMELAVTMYPVEALAIVEREMVETLDKLRALASKNGGAVHYLSSDFLGENMVVVTADELADIEIQKARMPGAGYDLPERLKKKKDG